MAARLLKQQQAALIRRKAASLWWATAAAAAAAAGIGSREAANGRRTMSQQAQPQRPVTYSDVLGVEGRVGEQPVTKEDAAMMQSVETAATGETLKGGAAARMQSAADRNVARGVVSPDAHTFVAEEGISLDQVTVPGAVLRTECVAGQPVAVAAETDPSSIPVGIPVGVMAPELVGVDVGLEPVTIGEALEAAALGAGSQPLGASDMRAIQSAETRATGKPLIEKGGLAATAQSAASKNESQPGPKTTLSDVLMDASIELPADRIATREDADKVTEAERRGGPDGSIRAGGVADCMQAAADLNESMGITK